MVKTLGKKNRSSPSFEIFSLLKLPIFSKMAISLGRHHFHPNSPITTCHLPPLHVHLIPAVPLSPLAADVTVYVLGFQRSESLWNCSEATWSLNESMMGNRFPVVIQKPPTSLNAVIISLARYLTAKILFPQSPHDQDRKPVRIQFLIYDCDGVIINTYQACKIVQQGKLQGEAFLLSANLGSKNIAVVITSATHTSWLGCGQEQIVYGWFATKDRQGENRG